LLLGLDVGTTAVKALLVDEAGRPAAQATVEYPISHPRPGWSEQDSQDWWDSLVRATRQVLADAEPAHVTAMAISTQGDTMVPVDSAGRGLAPARTWMDTRGAELIVALEGAIGRDDWYDIAGASLGPYAAAITVAWLRENLPDVYEETARFALVQDFILQRLTGSPLLDYPNASRTLLFDTRSRDWSAALTDCVGVSQERLSPVGPSGAPAGELTRAAAEALGLPQGTTVALGGHDQTCAAIGAGVVRPGTMLLSCGTAWVQLASVDAPLLDAGLRRVQTYCHAAPDRWALLTAHAGGNILAWLRDTLYEGEDTVYDEITAEAAQAACGQVAPIIVLPHFYGGGSPDWLRAARGAILGLRLDCTRPDIALGVLQGVAIEVLRHFLALRDMGAATDEIRMIGGGAKSAVWAQMIADATGARVVRPRVREAASFGAAILAGVAAGVFPCVEDVVDNLTVHDCLEPREGASEAYARRLDLCGEAMQALRPVWSGLGPVR